MRNWFLIVILCLAVNGFAQRVELGLLGGVCNYWGDLSPTMVSNETQPTFGFFTRLNLNHTWAIKAELNRLTVSGADANFDFNKTRNLSFKSDINEAAVIFEFNYLKYSTHVLDENFTSYLFLGVGAFQFNPQAQLNGTWYDLSDYKTEGVDYKKLSVAVPFGIGIKWMLSKKFAFESQLNFRKTYTDYLDDVSNVYPDVTSRFNDGGLISATLTDRSVELYGIPQFKNGYKRGDPSHKDWYMGLTMGFSMRLNTRSKCPRFF
jgi:hypothetical protein